MLYKIVVISTALLWGADTQDPSCDYSQNVEVGQTYYVYSPGFPENYTSGVQCRWIARCPNEHNCRLQCSEINIPQSPSCSQDRLLVSRSGDPQLTGADTYCGKGTLMVTSLAQQLSVGLITSPSSGGGRFICQLTAQRSSTENTCSCGYKKSNRIVGGQETGVNEFPMMAGLVDTRIRQVYCGAVIIYNRYLVTAAHCLTNMKQIDVLVVVGLHNKSGGTPATQAFKVSSVLIHPKYEPSNYDYDIALILTSNDIVFSDQVGPACLPFKFLSDSFSGAQVIALGWGTLDPGGVIPDSLRKVTLDVTSQASCRANISSLTDRQMCTYTPGKDACQYDSGGPLLYSDPSTGLLFHVGIISYGRFCASGLPGVNTRITELLGWITMNTADAEYCRK